MSSTDSIQKLFEDALQSMSLQLPEVVLQKLVAYQSHLLKWNKTINLTAHRDVGESVEKNFMDSLSVASHLTGNRILDFGSGAGFPGLVLAIIYPEKSFFLVEADVKKTSFLKYIVTTLGLKNVFIITHYVKSVNVLEVFPPHLDTIVSRATISPEILIEFANQCLERGHYLLLMLSEKQISNFDLASHCSFEIAKKQKYLLPWSKIAHSLLMLRKK